MMLSSPHQMQAYGELLTYVQRQELPTQALWTQLAPAAALALLAYGGLLGATTPVAAVFAFLAYVLALLPFFFCLGADYLGSIHLLVYPGAILIFFAFATLTTDQRGSWGRWRSGADHNSTVAAVTVASSLLSCWYMALAPTLGGGLDFNRFYGNQPRGYMLWSHGFRTATLGAEESSTSLVALGSELFGRRLLSLQLLGLLLLVAFLASLAFLAEGRRRANPLLLPTLGAGSVVLLHYGQPLRWEGFSLRPLLEGSGYGLVLLALLALGLGCLAVRRYAFVQAFLLLEGLGLALNGFYVVGAAANGSLEGETLVVYAVAVAAAETAVGLSLFLALVLGNSPRRPATVVRSARRLALASLATMGAGKFPPAYPPQCRGGRRRFLPPNFRKYFFF